MASAIGHALGAVVAWETGRRLPGAWVPRERRWYLVPAVLGALPDLDVVVWMVLRPDGPIAHRGPSHSLLVAVVLGVLAAAACKLGKREAAFPRLAAVLVAAACLHPVLDYLMACGPPVPFFWPLASRGYLSPVQLIPTAYYARSPAGLFGLLFHPATWAGIGLELVSLGGAWLAIRSRVRLRTITFAVVSAFGVFVTWLLYN